MAWSEITIIACAVLVIARLAWIIAFAPADDEPAEYPVWWSDDWWGL